MEINNSNSRDGPINTLVFVLIALLILNGITTAGLFMRVRSLECQVLRVETLKAEIRQKEVERNNVENNIIDWLLQLSEDARQMSLNRYQDESKLRCPSGSESRNSGGGV